MDTRAFDDRGRMTQQSFGSVLALSNAYYPNGDTQSAAMVVGGAHGDLLGLELDGARRLTKETLSATEQGQSLQSSAREYLLDSSNNWQTVQRDGQLLDMNPDVSHAYAAVPDGAATYDNDGRQLSAGTTQYRYDAFGRLVAAGSCTYEYDALGRRVKESCNSKETLFGYSGDNLVGREAGKRGCRDRSRGPVSPGGPCSLVQPRPEAVRGDGQGRLGAGHAERRR